MFDNYNYWMCLFIRFIMSSMEISYDPTIIERLTFSIIVVSKVLEPNSSKRLEVIFRDRENLFIYDPIDNICAWGVSQGALVMVKWAVIHILMVIMCPKELRETARFDKSEIIRFDLLDKFVTCLIKFKEYSHNS